MVENPEFPNLLLDKKASAEIVEENGEWRALFERLRVRGSEISNMLRVRA